MNFDEIEKLAESIDGFLSQNGKNLREGEVLFHLSRRLKKNSIAVEIGSWKGKSTVWLGKGIEKSANEGTLLYAIDPHVGSSEHQKSDQKVWTFPEFKNNIEKAKLQYIVHPLAMTSAEGVRHVKSEIDLIFMDGAHDYDSVKNDFETWFPKVKVGGTMAFHDSFIGWEGVQRLVDKEVFLSNQFKKVRYINSITYAIKTDRLSFFEKMENYCAFSIKKIHIWSLRFPQPFKSFAKKAIWRPFQISWLKKLTCSL